MFSCLTDSMLLWMLGGLVLLLHTLKKFVWDVSKFENKKYDLDRIPGPLKLPFLGTTWTYFWRYKTSKIHEAYEDMVRRYGPVIMEFPSPNQCLVSVTSKEDIEKVLRYPSRYPFRPPSEIIKLYRLARPEHYASSGMVHEQGEVWHSLRTKTTSELTSNKTIMGFLPELNNLSDEFMQLIKNSRNKDLVIDDLTELTCKYGLETCCTLMLGQRMSFLNDKATVNAQKLQRSVKERFVAERDSLYFSSVEEFMKTDKYKSFIKAEEELYSVISEIIETASNSKDTVYDDVQTILLSIVNNPDLDVREKRSTLIDFIVAGMSTFTSVLIFLFYELAKNPECQEKILEELEQISPNSNHIMVTDLSKMTYTKACMNETFRLIPLAFGLTRILEEDMTLGGYRLPTGTLVLCHNRVACLDEKNFNRAKEFLPERWLNEKESQNAASSGIFAPFGIGRRMCPGKRFIEQALVVTLAKAVREYVIDFEGSIDVEFQFILTPKTPTPFRFKDRC